MPLTEDQIERRVETMMNHLDAVFVSGGMTQENYDKAVADLNRWSEAKYAERETFARGQLRKHL
jgi:hypothetical protein